MGAEFQILPIRNAHNKIVTLNEIRYIYFHEMQVGVALLFGNKENNEFRFTINPYQAGIIELPFKATKMKLMIQFFDFDSWNIEPGHLILSKKLLNIEYTQNNFSGYVKVLSGTSLNLIDTYPNLIFKGITALGDGTFIGNVLSENDDAGHQVSIPVKAGVYYDLNILDVSSSTDIDIIVHSIIKPFSGYWSTINEINF